MKTILFIFLIAITTQLAIAQSVVTINKTKKNAALFDDSTPNSLFGILKSSYENLGYFDVKGMSDSLVNSLSLIERSKLYASTTNEIDVMYDENGEEQVFYDSLTGMYELKYRYPDTVYTSLDNIEHIVLNIEEGKGSKFSRINTIEFWRNYNGNMNRVMTISADVLSMKGFKYIEEVNENIQAAWLDKSNAHSLWNKMKIAALETRERQRVMDEESEEKDFHMSFFPPNHDFPFYFSLMSVATNLKKNPEEITYLQARNYYKTERMPFQFSYGDALSADSNSRLAIESHFTSVKRYWFFSLTERYDEDPDSPNYGEQLVIETEDGSLEYAHEDPELIYVWLEYEDVKLYAVKEFLPAKNDNERVSKIVGLIFTQKTANGKPEIVSYSPTKGIFESDFGAYPINKLYKLPWYSLLRKETKKRKTQIK
jgi:hypothetical protein